MPGSSHRGLDTRLMDGQGHLNNNNVLKHSEGSFSFVGSVRSSRSHNVRLVVRPYGSGLSRALNFHHSGSGLSYGSLSGLSPVSQLSKLTW